MPNASNGIIAAAGTALLAASEAMNDWLVGENFLSRSGNIDATVWAHKLVGMKDQIRPFWAYRIVGYVIKDCVLLNFGIGDQ